MKTITPSFKKTFQLLKKQDKAYFPVSLALISIGVVILGYYGYLGITQGYASGLGSTLWLPGLALASILGYPLGMLCDKKVNTEKTITDEEYTKRKADGTLDDIFTYVI